jgi:hypothetical protein
LASARRLVTLTTTTSESRPSRIVLTPSIISVSTYTLTLYPQYRAGADQQVPLAAPSGSKGSFAGRAPRSSSSGGIVSWFLFLLKVSIQTRDLQKNGS